jgi:hypothetical protein
MLEDSTDLDYVDFTFDQCVLASYLAPANAVFQSNHTLLLRRWDKCVNFGISAAQLHLQLQVFTFMIIS